ncbi:STAS domain-containing protein [Ottowia sp. VDI28]|uniref:STAS domain-containing protein n=1 Tax=Ottowia sp. VDI28 TaxID=3133968 RepID=UPI003C2F5B13
MADRVRQAGAHTAILSLEMSDDLDSTALEAIGELSRTLNAQNCQLMLARIKDPARLGLERSGLNSDGRPGARLFWSVDDAVSAA